MRNISFYSPVGFAIVRGVHSIDELEVRISGVGVDTYSLFSPTATANPVVIKCID